VWGVRDTLEWQHCQHDGGAAQLVFKSMLDLLVGARWTFLGQSLHGVACWVLSTE